MKSFLYYGVLAALLTLTQGQMKNKVDVQAEVNKIVDRFEQFEKPSPQIIEGFVEQVRESCRTNRTIDPAVMNATGECVSKLFNQTALAAEFQAAIPKGDLDDVFRSVCLKWPQVKVCLNQSLEYVEECWAEGTKITKALDSMVNFFCEQDNSGAKIALFFAEGGLQCLEANGNAVRDCVSQQAEQEHQDLCKSVVQIHSCLAPLRKCKDVTPENLISSMMRQVGKALECPPLVDAYTIRKEGTSASSQLVSVASSFFLIVFALLAQN